VTVLVIEESATEAALMAAGFALHPEVRVLDAGDEGGAAKRLEKPAAPVVLAIAGAAALSNPATSLFKRLGAQGIPVIGIAANLSDADKGRALKAGVQEVHERPTEWPSYAQLIESLVSRYIRP
jgi:chemotaxis response regulator CheB